MDSQPLPLSHETPKRQTPWGLFVGLVLILAIIVSGAYYAFEKRIGTFPSSSSTQGQAQY